MATKEAKARAQAKYDAANTKQYHLKLNITKDADIIDRFNQMQSVQGYIKELIRKDIRKENGMFYKVVEIDTYNNSADEFDVMTTIDKEEAIRKAKSFWDGLSDHDKQYREIEVRVYEDEDDVDYDTIEWN